jgi:hypothetical protein
MVVLATDELTGGRMTEFKFLDENPLKFSNNDYHLVKNKILLEIAHQLKRIADSSEIRG